MDWVLFVNFWLPRWLWPDPKVSQIADVFSWMRAGRLDCSFRVGGQAEQTRGGREAEVGNSKSLFVVPGWGPPTRGCFVGGGGGGEY